MIVLARWDDERERQRAKNKKRMLTSATIDIEPEQDLCRALVELEDDLDVAIVGEGTQDGDGSEAPNDLRCLAVLANHFKDVFQLVGSLVMCRQDIT